MTGLWIVFRTTLTNIHAKKNSRRIRYPLFPICPSIFDDRELEKENKKDTISNKPRITHLRSRATARPSSVLLRWRLQCCSIPLPRPPRALLCLVGASAEPRTTAGVKEGQGAWVRVLAAASQPGAPGSWAARRSQACGVRSQHDWKARPRKTPRSPGADGGTESRRRLCRSNACGRWCVRRGGTPAGCGLAAWGQGPRCGVRMRAWEAAGLARQSWWQDENGWLAGAAARVAMRHQAPGGGHVASWLQS